jgi:hypothetical protein
MFAIYSNSIPCGCTYVLRDNIIEDDKSSVPEE